MTQLWFIAASVGLLLNLGHVASPIVLAWITPRLRATVRREWVKYIAAPVLVMGSVAFIPFAWLTVIYFSWNAYHFGMQNFGVCAMYGRRGWGFAALCATMLAMGVVPLFHLDATVMALGLGALSLHHWLTDLWLSGRATRWRWSFVLTVPACVALWLCFQWGLMSLQMHILAMRYGIGMVHFGYSARFGKELSA